MSKTNTASSNQDRYNRPMPLYFQAFDPDSPVFIVKSVLASTTFGSALGGVSAFQANASPLYSAVQTAKVYGVLSTAFFGIREYLVSPILVASQITPGYTRRFEQLSEKQKGKLPQGPTSLSDIKHQRVIDSGISGGMAFGAYSYLTRGIKVVPRAAFTAGLLGTALQYLVNYSRVARLHFLSNSINDKDPEEEEKMSLTQQIRFSSQNPTEPLQGVDGDDTLAGRVLHLMTYVAPLKKMTREESYQRLLEERKRIDRRLSQIEAEENKIFEWVQARSREQEIKDGAV